MSLKVAVRLRPFNQREKERNETETIIDMVLSNKKFLFHKKNSQQRKRILVEKYIYIKKFKNFNF